MSHHHAFALFQLYAVIINIPICIFWAGGLERVSAIVTETPPLSLFLIILFSFVWGFGTLFFGIACKVAGVGIGTNLSMGIIAIIGTFLPLITENTLFTSFGAVICVGLAICCAGLWLATKALVKKDLDDALVSAQDCNETDNDVDTSELDNSKNEKDIEQNVTKPKARTFSTIHKVIICLITGVTAVQLQFAFIFGEPVTDLAEGEIEGVNLPGKTPLGGSAGIIWLLAISLGAPASIINGLWSSPVPLSHSLRAPWWRHLRLVATTSIPWVCHIHLYGLTTTSLFPENMAASVAWPLLMMITNLWALLLSKILGEWKNAGSDTIRLFVNSVCITMVGLLVLMASVFIPTNKTNATILAAD